jgi:hypothetical protein
VKYAAVELNVDVYAIKQCSAQNIPNKNPQSHLIMDFTMCDVQFPISDIHFQYHVVAISAEPNAGGRCLQDSRAKAQGEYTEYFLVWTVECTIRRCTRVYCGTVDRGPWYTVCCQVPMYRKPGSCDLAPSCVTIDKF